MSVLTLEFEESEEHTFSIARDSGTGSVLPALG